MTITVNELQHHIDNTNAIITDMETRITENNTKLTDLTIANQEYLPLKLQNIEYRGVVDSCNKQIDVINERITYLESLN